VEGIASLATSQSHARACPTRAFVVGAIVAIIDISSECRDLRATRVSAARIDECALDLTKRRATPVKSIHRECRSRVRVCIVECIRYVCASRAAWNASRGAIACHRGPESARLRQRKREKCNARGFLNALEVARGEVGRGGERSLKSRRGCDTVPCSSSVALIKFFQPVCSASIGIRDCTCVVRSLDSGFGNYGN